MLGRTDSRARLIALLVVFALVALALVGRLAFWQVAQRDMLLARATDQTSVRFEEPARRGEIYDRSGTVVLATSVERDRLAAAPKGISPATRSATADGLIDILELDEAAATKLRAALSTERAYVVVARGIEPAISERIRAAIRAGQLSGLTLEPEPVRLYPQEGGGPDSTLASHLLGFVNREGIGQYGVEAFYEAELGGSPRVVAAERDINGRTIFDSETLIDPGIQGRDVRLTIDAGLQLSLEQELLAAWIADKAKSVSAVVLDPYTGEVYAMGTYPAYDANDYKRIAAAEPSRFIDPIVSSVYEPGSVLKMLTASSALEHGTVTTKTRIKDVGTLRLDGGRTKIDNANRKGRGWMTFEDAIAWSRNVVAAKVALDLGRTTAESANLLHATWRTFGFGQPTGIDVAAEVGGLVRDPGVRAWREVDLANGSFGQGIAVTPIQLATAFSAMVNGGELPQPHVVQAVGETGIARATRGTIISAGLSRTLTKLMLHVVSEVPFYRDRTLVPGFEVGGKTGTAQIWDGTARGGRGAWKNNRFNYSFVGYIGRQAGRPDLVVAVRIEEGSPTTLRVGQIEMPVMSFELFRRIAHDAVTTPGLLPARLPLKASTTDDR